MNSLISWVDQSSKNLSIFVQTCRNNIIRNIPPELGPTTFTFYSYILKPNVTFGSQTKLAHTTHSHKWCEHKFRRTHTLCTNTHSASVALGEPSRQDFAIDLDQRVRGAGNAVCFQRRATGMCVCARMCAHVCVCNYSYEGYRWIWW